jgi:hypothetical protein
LDTSMDAGMTFLDEAIYFLVRVGVLVKREVLE